MATEPQWQRPWEERPTEHSQSSDSPAAVKKAQTAVRPSFDKLPLDTASSKAHPSFERLLPPLHVSLNTSTEAVQPSLLHSRPTSLTYSESEVAPPNIACHYEVPSNKRKRVRGAEPESYSGLSALAYSPQVHDAPPSQPSQRTIPSHVQLETSHGGHATGRAAFTEITQSAETRGPSYDLPAISNALTDCCSDYCSGKRCSTLRALVADLTSEFRELDLRLHGAITGSAQLPHIVAPDLEQVGFIQTLEWVVERLRWNNAGIRSLAPAPEHTLQNQDFQKNNPSSGNTLSLPREVDENSTTLDAESLETMKRRHSQADQAGMTPPQRSAPPLQPAPVPAAIYSPASLASQPRRTQGFSPSLPEESWRNPHSQPGEQLPAPYSPHQRDGSSGSAFHRPQQSPMLTSKHPLPPQTSRILPSPTSLTFSTAQSSTPLPMTSGHEGSPLHRSPTSTPAHVQHLQDLQHQVSVKTLALQTLQREYDALLAKLERQRTKCITLEKKFEVSDVEINSLTEERERLQAQVATLEGQAVELTKSRDDARREMAESGRQYVRIVEMASRLEAQGADERRRWADERKKLLDKVRGLELGLPDEEDRVALGEVDMDVVMAEGEFTTEQRGSLDEPIEQSGAANPSEARSQGAGSGGASALREPLAETVAGPSAQAPSPNLVPTLRAEVRRLRSRTQTLEDAIRTMKEENRSMQEALQAVTISGQRMQESMDKALGT